MNVSARTLRANLWWAASKSSQLQAPTPLRDYLVAQAIAARQLLAAGSIHSNIANGHTTEFDSKGMTAQEVIDMWVYLVECFDIALADLIAGSKVTYTDAQVQAQMELKLRPVVNFTNNWMFLAK